MTKDQLINHHLCFLKQNRGKHQSLKNIEIISGDKASFDITFILNFSSDLSFNSQMLYLPDWLNNEKDKIFKKENYSAVGSITYMSANSKIFPNWKTNNSIQIKRVENASDLETFSEVQSRGFCETEEIYNEWHPWLSAKNSEGFDYNNQFFYVASIDDKPIGVCLLVKNENIYGIYAVATEPHYRKQGVATTTMKKALEECLGKQNADLTLQVMTNSYAEKLYTELGFAKEFCCGIYRRNKKKSSNYCKKKSQ